MTDLRTRLWMEWTWLMTRFAVWIAAICFAAYGAGLVFP